MLVVSLLMSLVVSLLLLVVSLLLLVVSLLMSLVVSLLLLVVSLLMSLVVSLLMSLVVSLLMSLAKSPRPRCCQGSRRARMPSPRRLPNLALRVSCPRVSNHCGAQAPIVMQTLVVIQEAHDYG